MPHLGTLATKLTNLNQLKQLHAHLVQISLHHQSYYASLLLTHCTRLNAPPSYARPIFNFTPNPNVYLFTCMLKYYSQMGAHDEVLSLFQSMLSHNIKPDAFVYPVVIKSFGDKGFLFHALVLKLGYGEDRYIRNVIMDCYGKYGPIELCRKVFDEMTERSLTDWNSMISGYWKWGLEGEVYSLVKMLDQRQIRLNCFLKTALLDMYAKCGSLETAQRIFDDLGIYRNIVTWNAMISAYMRVGDLSSARELFDKMLQRNVVSWNSMIAGYAQNGQSAMAINLFKEMTKTKEVKPDEVTMVSVISACGHLGALELGNWAVNFLTKNHINLSVSGYNALIFMYSKCGSIKDSERIFQEMSTRDAVSYNTLIAGFAAHGHGKEAMEQMSKMIEEASSSKSILCVIRLADCKWPDDGGDWHF
ncbi:hypothetical protein Patl1_36656 [Pistacia atlantica]|nr:hypothetical protein Patl1_36656 [Pistacia atlantica]